MTKKPRLTPEAHARRIYALVRKRDGRVLEVFCTRDGATFYRAEQYAAFHWKKGSVRIVPGQWAPDAPKAPPSV